VKIPGDIRNGDGHHHPVDIGQDPGNEHDQGDGISSLPEGHGMLSFVMYFVTA
jgi:hypothetical protein